MISRKDFAEWRTNPVTEVFIEWVKKSADGVKDGILSPESKAKTIDEMALNLNFAQAKHEAYQDVFNVNYDQMAVDFEWPKEEEKDDTE